MRGVLPAHASDWLNALSLLTSALANFPLGAAEATAATNATEVANTRDLRTFKQISDLYSYGYPQTGPKRDRLAVAPASDFVAGKVAVAIAIDVAEVPLPMWIRGGFFK